MFTLESPGFPLPAKVLLIVSATTTFCSLKSPPEVHAILNPTNTPPFVSRGVLLGGNDGAEEGSSLRIGDGALVGAKVNVGGKDGLWLGSIVGRELGSDDKLGLGLAHSVS